MRTSLWITATLPVAAPAPLPVLKGEEAFYLIKTFCCSLQSTAAHVKRSEQLFSCCHEETFVQRGNLEPILTSFSHPPRARSHARMLFGLTSMWVKAVRLQEGKTSKGCWDLLQSAGSKESAVKWARRGERKLTGGRPSSVTLRFLHGCRTMMKRRLGWMRRCRQICLLRFKNRHSVRVTSHIFLIFLQKRCPQRSLLALICEYCPTDCCIMSAAGQTHTTTHELRGWQFVSGHIFHIWNQSGKHRRIQSWCT